MEGSEVRKTERPDKDGAFRLWEGSETFTKLFYCSLAHGQ